MPHLQSVVNGRTDYDEWEREGAEGWSYKDLRPYFLKSEGFSPTVNNPDIRADEHGTSGPWKTRRPGVDPISKIMLKSCANVGIPITKDFNTPRGTLGATTWTAFMDGKGYSEYKIQTIRQIYPKNSPRLGSSSATAYLTSDVLARRNLFVALTCCVEKILFDNGSNMPRAIGVELRTSRDGPLFRVSARKEVILSAGAYVTPQLLMISGIGPRAELEEKEIKVIKDLPAVGKNLVDHAACGSVVYRTTKSLPTYDRLNNPLRALVALVQWYITGKGPMAVLTSPGGAFIRSDDPSLPYDTPGEQTPRNLVDLTSGPNAPDLEIAWWKQFLNILSFPLIGLDGGLGKTPPGIQGITISVVSLRPKSSGEVTLKTNSVWDKPIVDPKWFSDEHDMHVLTRGLRLILKIARAKPFADFADYREDKKYPFLWLGTQDPDALSEEELHGFIRQKSTPAWHPACTARMGKSEDSSVVDTKLQVHGIRSLRIIDTSVFPKQISGHPCAPVIAMAEKASDMIKKAHTG
ncbi:hypothetical protein Clacol_007953 [Clathrus columnatus]|uniref:Glucose-methanol-choline oxidoreductase N-terminal domain-containing protein n=1 Tax=Clathrus columnatus TaxID=1419009 RepID=A0AAV5AGC5_9AGAM|nr:hypothetical protein Clacol_007953 [Clathrus columnatus]